MQETHTQFKNISGKKVDSTVIADFLEMNFSFLGQVLLKTQEL